MTIVMYSKDSCPFCERAKALLTEHNYEYTVKNIVNPQTKEELLSRFPEARTVPQIFFGDLHIGGYTELKTYLEQSL
jgi:glutaredoxin 3